MLPIQALLPIRPFCFAVPTLLDKEDMQRYGIVDHAYKTPYPDLVLSIEATLQTKKKYFEDNERLRMVETNLWCVNFLFRFIPGGTYFLSPKLAKAHGIAQLHFCTSTFLVFKELFFQVKQAEVKGFLEIKCFDIKKLKLADFGLKINKTSEINKETYDNLRLIYDSEDEGSVLTVKSSHTCFNEIEFRLNFSRWDEGIYFVTPKAVH